MINKNSFRKISTVVLGALGVALASAGMAADGTQNPSWYFGLHAGVNDVRGDWNGTVSFGPTVSLPGTVAVKRGHEFGLQGGRQAGRMRYELELQHGNFDVSSIHLGPLTEPKSASGHYDALTANAYRFQPLSERFNVYAALGIGAGRVSLPQLGFTTPGCNCFAAASKTGFVWLARVGAEFDVTQKDKAFLQYTYLALPGPTSDSTPGVEYERRKVGAVSLGYRRLF